MTIVPAATAALLCGCGTYLLLQRQLTRIVIGLALLGHGANLLVLLASGRGGAPTFVGSAPDEQFLDPLPQAFVLQKHVVHRLQQGLLLSGRQVEPLAHPLVEIGTRLWLAARLDGLACAHGQATHVQMMCRECWPARQIRSIRVRARRRTDRHTRGLDDAAVGTEPAGRGQLGLQVQLASIQLARVVKMLDFFATVGINDRQLVAIPLLRLSRLAADELAMTLEEKDHMSNRNRCRAVAWGAVAAITACSSIFGVSVQAQQGVEEAAVHKVLDQYIGRSFDPDTNLAALKRELGEKTEAILQEEQVLEKYTGWTMGDLPELMEINRGGQTLLGYPALVDAGDGVDVLLLIDQALQSGGELAGQGMAAALAEVREVYEQQLDALLIETAPEHRRLSRYDTMSVEEICALPVDDVMKDQSHLYLWVPNALLAEGLRVMAAWGFTYKANLVWAKRRKDGGPDGRGDQAWMASSIARLARRSACTFASRRTCSNVTRPIWRARLRASS